MKGSVSLPRRERGREVERRRERQGERERPPCTSVSLAISLSPDCTLSLAIPRFLLRLVNSFTHSCPVLRSRRVQNLDRTRFLFFFAVCVSSRHLSSDSVQSFVLTFSLIYAFFSPDFAIWPVLFVFFNAFSVLPGTRLLLFPHPSAVW